MEISKDPYNKIHLLEMQDIMLDAMCCIQRHNLDRFMVKERPFWKKVFKKSKKIK